MVWKHSFQRRKLKEFSPSSSTSVIRGDFQTRSKAKPILLFFIHCLSLGSLIYLYTRKLLFLSLLSLISFLFNDVHILIRSHCVCMSSRWRGRSFFETGGEVIPYDHDHITWFQCYSLFYFSVFIYFKFYPKKKKIYNDEKMKSMKIKRRISFFLLLGRDVTFNIKIMSWYYL